MKLTNKNLTAFESLFVLAAVLAIAALVYALYCLSAFVLHRWRVTAAIPLYLEALKSDREKLSAAIERYHDHFGFYPPNRSTNFSTRAFNNTLYYELVGTRWYTNYHFFGLPTTKDPVEPAKILKAFNMTWFSNSLVSPAWPTNFLNGLRFAGREEDDVIHVVSTGPETIDYDFTDDFHISTWRYEADRPEHNKGKFDLWVEVEVLSQKFRIQNW